MLAVGVADSSELTLLVSVIYQVLPGAQQAVFDYGRLHPNSIVGLQL